MGESGAEERPLSFFSQQQLGQGTSQTVLRRRDQKEHNGGGSGFGAPRAWTYFISQGESQRGLLKQSDSPDAFWSVRLSVCLSACVTTFCLS